jgi:hypothetical protein
MSSRNRVLGGILAFAVTASGGLAHAADADGCFTPVGGIDGVNPDISVIGLGVNDARWNGAFGYGWETGALGEAEYKSIIGTNPANPAQRMLYVSWRRKMTSSDIAGIEGIQLGFGYTPAGATQPIGQILQVSFGLAGDVINTPTPKNADGSITGVAPASVALLYKLGVGTAQPWRTNTGGDAWLYDATRMFVLQDAGGQLYWVVQMALPIKSAPEADPTVASSRWLTPGIYVDPVNMVTPTPANPNPAGIPYWADVIQSLPSTSTVVFRSWPDPGLSNPTTPNYVVQERDMTGGLIGTPAPAHWSSMNPGSPRDGTCVGRGLSFTNHSGDIMNLSAQSAGVWDGSLLMYRDVGGTITPQANQLAVTVHNNAASNANIARSAVRAAFSIAPYGSQAGARTAAWAPLYDNGNRISCSSPGNCSTDVGNQIVAGFSGAGTIPATGSFTMNATLPWTPARSYLCAVVDQSGIAYRNYPAFSSSNYCLGQPWLPANQNPSLPTTMWDGLPFHTCMQVELSTSGAGGGVTFANKSAFRNMYAVPASEYNEQAIIDTRGLPPGKTKVGGKLGHYIYLYTETRNMPHIIPGGDNGPGSDDVDARASLVSTNARRKSGPSYDDVATVLPTMAIHTFWDTGHTTRIQGKRLRVLEPMTSYGNFVVHDYKGEGPVYGWDATLEGAEKLGPTTYRIFVPNEGRASVKTHIEALPNPRCEGNVKPSMIAELVKGLNGLLVSSPSSQKKLSDCVRPAVIRCIDLFQVLNEIDDVDWGTWDSWISLIVKQIKAASGCHC